MPIGVAFFCFQLFCSTGRKVASDAGDRTTEKQGIQNKINIPRKKTKII